jgi:Flp pilus assembly protein TadD
LNYAAGGGHPFGYHLTNVLIHVLNTLLVFAVVLSLTRVLLLPNGRYMALAVAALFACHPLNTQPVNYISARSTLLVGGFSLLCLFLFIRRYEVRDGEKNTLLFFGSLAAYAGALLSKEEAVALPGILAFFELCRLRPPFSKERLMKVTVSLLPFLFLTLAFLLYVTYGLRVIGDTPQARGLGENLLTQAKSIFFYVKLMVLPVNLSIDHTIATSTSLLAPGSFASVLLLALVLVGSLSIVYTAPALSFGIWWFILTLVPTSTLVALKLVVNEQRMYFAGVGLMITAVAGIGPLMREAEHRYNIAIQKYVVAGFVLLLACFSAMTISRNVRWRTPLALWSDALAQYPDSMRANTIVAGIYLDQNRPAEALPLAEKAVKVAPDTLETRTILARTYSRLGRQDDALREARAAFDLNPASSEAHSLLGVVYARLERYSEAREAWQRAVELDPQNIEAKENLQKLDAASSK